MIKLGDGICGVKERGDKIIFNFFGIWWGYLLSLRISSVFGEMINSLVCNTLNLRSLGN